MTVGRGHPSALQKPGRSVRTRLPRPALVIARTGFS
jgi:hypothetical protein